MSCQWPNRYNKKTKKNQKQKPKKNIKNLIKLRGGWEDILKIWMSGFIAIWKLFYLQLITFDSYYKSRLQALKFGVPDRNQTIK